MPVLDGNIIDVKNELFHVNSNQLILNYCPITSSRVSNVKVKHVLVEVHSRREFLYRTKGEYVDDAEVWNLGYKDNRFYRTPKDGFYTSMFVDVYAKYFDNYVKLEPKLVDINPTTHQFEEFDLSTLDTTSVPGEDFRFYLLFKNIMSESIKVINNDKIFPAKIIVITSGGLLSKWYEFYTYFIPPNNQNMQIPVKWCLPYAIDSRYKRNDIGIYVQSSVTPPSDPTRRL